VRAFLALLLAIALPLGAQSASVFRYMASVPMVSFSDIGIGSGYYVRDRVVRTAAHVVFKDTLPISVDGEPAALMCRDIETDSVTLSVVSRARVTLVEGDVLSRDGRFTIAGWASGRYLEIDARFVSYSNEKTKMKNGTEVGPLYVFVIERRDPRGMSGGPVIDEHGRAVATITSYGHSEEQKKTFIGAVPIVAAACKSTGVN